MFNLKGIYIFFRGTNVLQKHIFALKDIKKVEINNERINKLPFLSWRRASIGAYFGGLAGPGGIVGGAIGASLGTTRGNVK